MKKVTSETLLSDVLEEARSKGRIRIRHGKEVFVVSVVRERLPEEARDFLMRGGTVEDD